MAPNHAGRLGRARLATMIRLAPRCLPFATTALLTALCGCVQTGGPESRQASAAPVTWSIASFNMGWAGTPAEFARHVSICSAPAVSYCDTRPRIERGAKAATDMEKARAAKCQ